MVNSKNLISRIAIWRDVKKHIPEGDKVRLVFDSQSKAVPVEITLTQVSNVPLLVDENFFQERAAYAVLEDPHSHLFELFDKFSNLAFIRRTSSGKWLIIQPAVCTNFFITCLMVHQLRKKDENTAKLLNLDGHKEAIELEVEFDWSTLEEEECQDSHRAISVFANKGYAEGKIWPFVVRVRTLEGIDLYFVVFQPWYNMDGCGPFIVRLIDSDGKDRTDKELRDEPKYFEIVDAMLHFGSPMYFVVKSHLANRNDRIPAGYALATVKIFQYVLESRRYRMLPLQTSRRPMIVTNLNSSLSD